MSRDELETQYKEVLKDDYWIDSTDPFRSNTIDIVEVDVDE